MATLTASSTSARSIASARQRRRRLRWGGVFLALCLGTAGLFVLSLFLGSVTIPVDQVLQSLLGNDTLRPAWNIIVQDYRLPKAVTALFAGGALATAGLALQSLFRNPLADAYVLGVSSGASLGVALVVLTVGVGSSTLLSGLGATGDVAVIAAASLGAAVVMLVILAAARRVQNAATLLIIGLMFGYATGALVSVLTSTAIPERLQAYVNWMYGTFGDVTRAQLGLFIGAILIGLGLMAAAAKPLNALALGEDAAQMMGVHVRRARILSMAAAALLAGTVTAFCGPIGFIGIAVPYFARVTLRTASHIVLIPAVFLLGGMLALTADMIAQVPGSERILPLNAVIALFGAPVVIWILVHERRFRTNGV